MAELYRPEEGTPNMVVIGLPHVKSLERALEILKENQIPHYAWSEPDNDFGLTAIATIPISGSQRNALRQYRVYNVPLVLITKTSPSKGEDAGVNPAGNTNTVVAQTP